GDPRATAFSGNVTVCPKGSTQLLTDNSPSNSSGGGVTATISGSSKEFLTLTYAPSLNGAGLEVIVKGGSYYNEYLITVGTTDSTLLHAPFNSGGNLPTVSHYLVCETSPPVVVPPNTPEFTVEFGYADSYRPANFNGAVNPTPWQGSPNTIFVGCPSTAVCPNDGNGTIEYDAGAVLITNTGSSSFTVTPGVVTIGAGCTYNPWNNVGPVTVPAGDNLILTQTGQSGAMETCATEGTIIPGGGVYNFDTSESDSGTTGAGVCTPDGIIPQVTLTISGGVGTITENDTRQVLNTGGVDAGSCPAGTANNETTQWTLAGP
ncbi:MAG TPA: hypothetical protein VHT30_07930, partial [Acidimicrobiales bacterium]|nr:hypothetical protein [Acidimicrobiales bacterium]